MLLQTAIGVVSGLFGWTLLEYIIHYPLGHLPKGKTLVSSEHLKHHKDILYFSPRPLKIRGAVPVLAIVGLVAGYLAGVPFAVGFLLSVAAGWVTYEVLHQSIHVNGPRNWYSRWASKHHLYHHFMKPNRNHGVTTPLWDIIFGTHERVARVSIRERDIAAVPWLAEALAMGDDAPEFVRDYEKRTKPSPAAPLQ